ncbi:MAG: hypothetical protein AAFZ01_11225 [Pseudomonadota bacterium]
MNAQSLIKLPGLILFVMGLCFVFGYISFWLLAVFAVVGAVASVFLFRPKFWNEDVPHAGAIVHIDAHMAVRPTILKHVPPDGYRLTCLYFGSGLIDRTTRLDHGFRYEVLDRIPALEGGCKPFDELCDRRAHEIVREARRRNAKINLLWSGGIDSTTACVALMRASRDQPKQMRIFLSKESRKEYPAFHKEHLNGQFELQWIDNVGKAYRQDGLIVTGELGDQIFGSAKALEIQTQSLLRPTSEPFPGPLRKPWSDALYEQVRKRLASDVRAQAVLDYLTPQIETAPVAIDDLFTCLWWMNFSLKWQPVSLRMMGSAVGLSLTDFQSRTRHFFQTDDFQQWALHHAGQGVREDWTTYKWAARDYIYAFTGDDQYRRLKEKLPSLRGMMKPAVAFGALAISADGDLFWEKRDQSLKGPLATEVGIEIEASREAPLWDDLDDGE